MPLHSSFHYLCFKRTVSSSCASPTPLSCLVIGFLSFARGSLLSPHNLQRLHLASDHIQPHTVNAFLIYIGHQPFWLSSGLYVCYQKLEFREAGSLNLQHNVNGCTPGLMRVLIAYACVPLENGLSAEKRISTSY